MTAIVKLLDSGSIQRVFLSISNKNHLIGLLNLVSKEVSEKNKKPNSSYKRIKASAFNYYLYHKKNKYHVFQRPKKSGGFRSIKAPDPYLKSLQRYLNICFQASYIPKKAANGFVQDRNIRTNASLHVKKRFVYNVDVKDFFPSIYFGRVRKVLTLEPFNFNEEVSTIIANLCCDEGSIPQGAPTSPFISNLVCQRLDRKMIQLGQRYKFHYSRYADDLTFSSNLDIFNTFLRNTINNTIQNEGFEINTKKERLQNSTERQMVTGLIVNKKINIPRPKIKLVRAMIHSWAKKGYEKANTQFQSKNVSPYKKTAPLDRHLEGMLNYISMIRGKDDPIYLKLGIKFYFLNGNQKKMKQLMEYGMTKFGLVSCAQKFIDTDINKTSLSNEDFYKFTLA